MKKASLFIMLCLMSFFATAQVVFGKWRTIDDETGEAKSIVEIYKNKNGKVYGKIVEILREKNKNNVCDKCEGDEKNVPILGLNIIKNLEYDGEFYSGGTAFDPETGKTYKFRIGFDEDEPGKLQVRGYIAFFYKTQYWEPVSE